MGQQIIKQPDGKYALWSSVVDTFVLIDATSEDIVAFQLADEAERIRKSVERVVAQLEAGEKPYYQFTKTWKQALATHKTVHGEAFDIEAVRLLPDEVNR